MTDRPSDVVHCPECGAPLGSDESTCRLCQRRREEQEEANPYISPRSLVGEHVGGQFSLASLFLITTLVAVCLGLSLLSPGLGILLGIVAVPALVRTMAATVREKEAGLRITFVQKLETFVISVFLMGAVGIAGIIAFCFACTTGAFAAGAFRSNSNNEFAFALLMGAAAGLGLIGWLVWMTWPRRIRKSAEERIG
jgi:hypothetical protein